MQFPLIQASFLIPHATAILTYDADFNMIMLKAHNKYRKHHQIPPLELDP